MFEKAHMYAVLPAKNIERLKTFFAEKFGLDPDDEEMGVYFYTIGGSKLFIYQSSFAGTNQATALTLDVPDIATTIAELKAKAVEFEHYDVEGMELTGDIHTMFGTDIQSAWFKDSEGNIININQSA